MKSKWLVLLLPFLIVTSSSSTVPALGGCAIFPAGNIWNTRIDALPILANSSAYVEAIGSSAPLHPDFGAGLWEGGPIGIPFVIVPPDQPAVEVRFTAYGDESDSGPYPIPTDAPIEGGTDSDGDRHVLILQQGSCRLYELFRAYRVEGSWLADSGATYDLSSHELRPDGWTSADAAGLPILPGLVRVDEVLAGEIRHTLRITAPRTQRAYVWPARHFASSSSDPNLPPMGTRFRLRADFPVEKYSSQVQVILRAMQQYGVILADNGSPWYLSGAPDERWDNDTLRELRQVRGQDFEAVDVSELQISPNSGQARP